MMKLVTVATKSEGYFPVMVEACKRHGYDLQVLGWGQEWKGFSWRWTLLEAYVRTLPATEVMVWTDAYDVIPVNAASTALERFRLFRRPLVFSVESEDVDGLTHYHRNRMFGKCMKDVHLNGGLYMGEAAAILQMISELRTNYGFKDGDDDQRLLNRGCGLPYFEKYAGLDLDSRIFYNAVGYRETGPNARTGIVWGSHFDTCFVHGHSNNDLTPVLQEQGYTMTVSRRDQKQYVWGVIKHSASTFIPELLAGFLVAVLLVYFLWKHLLKKKK